MDTRRVAVVESGSIWGMSVSLRYNGINYEQGVN